MILSQFYFCEVTFRGGVNHWYTLPHSRMNFCVEFIYVLLLFSSVLPFQRLDLSKNKSNFNILFYNVYVYDCMHPSSTKRLCLDFPKSNKINVTSRSCPTACQHSNTKRKGPMERRISLQNLLIQ